MTKTVVLSPLRLEALYKLEAELGVTRDVLDEALRLRNNIPQLAKEYVQRKHLVELSEVERFPMWSQYLEFTSGQDF